MKSTKGLSICLIGLVLTACGPSYLLRRADRLTKKAIALGAVIKADTVYKTVHDTIQGIAGNTKEFRIGDVEVDTVWADSIRLIVRHDTIHHTKIEQINVQGPRIVSTIRVPYTVTKTITAPPKVDHTWRTVSFVLGGMFFLLMLAMVVGRILKG